MQEDEKEQYVVSIADGGWLTLDKHDADLHHRFGFCLCAALKASCYLPSREIAEMICNKFKHLLPEMSVMSVTEARQAQQKRYKEQKAEANVEAEMAAMDGTGLTKEQWDKEPETYIGHCFKQCYEDMEMVKGSIFEYGIRGIYVCSGCGYSYPPGCAPDEVKKKSRRNQVRK